MPQVQKYGRILPPAGEKCARETGLPYWVAPSESDAFDYAADNGISALADQLREVAVV